MALRSFGQKEIFGKFFLKVSTADGSESRSKRRSNLNFAACSFVFRNPSEKPPSRRTGSCRGLTETAIALRRELTLDLRERIRLSACCAQRFQTVESRR